MNKKQKITWNEYVYSMFPSKQNTEKARRLNRIIDKHMPRQSPNNEWRTLMKRQQGQKSH